jgi:hypothetical protein
MTTHARTPGPLLSLALASLTAACGPAGPAPADRPGAYGVPVGGYPSTTERTVQVLTNAVRLSPLDYRDRYAADFSPSLSASGVLAGYPSVAPLYWNHGLDQSARAHSLDMASTPCFQHDSCDGTSIWTRIAAYYTLSGTMGENIAAGYPDARAAMNAWLCDQSGAACCADHAACDGHRRNMMSGAFHALGAGYASRAGSPYGTYFTQDFGGVATALPATPPLVDGAHLLFPPGQTTFLANYFASADPRSVTLVLDGASHPLALELGVAARGSWSVALARGAGCRSYHFEAVDGPGAGWRFPASGELRTAGEGSCAEDYLP